MTKQPTVLDRVCPVPFRRPVRSSTRHSNPPHYSHYPSTASLTSLPGTFSSGPNGSHKEKPLVPRSVRGEASSVGASEAASW